MNPYECADSIKKLKETSPPTHENVVTWMDSSITGTDYTHAQCVWSAFNIKMFGDYHNL